MSGCYSATEQTKLFLIIFRRLSSVRYVGTFSRSVNNRHHIIQFHVYVHFPNLLPQKSFKLLS